MRFEGELYIDPMLPFGLRSAPKIFNAVADALNWILKQSGIRQVFHYLDDFVIIGPPSSPQCAIDLNRLEQVCSQLGVPLAAHKKEGPTAFATATVFLLIEIDTLVGELKTTRGQGRAA